MDINVQLNKLNGEIDAANIKIDAQMKEWKNATAEDKIFYASQSKGWTTKRKLSWQHAIGSSPTPRPVPKVRI